jgi:steroid delta-isomerase-like uncharacterized protein
VLEDDLIARWVRAADPFDPTALSAMYTDDAVYDDVPIGVITEGRDAIEALLRVNLDMFPDFRATDIAGFVTADRGAVQYTMNGTAHADEHTAIAKQFSVRGAAVLQLRGGLICRQTEYWDLATMLRQLDLPLPTADALADHGDEAP